MPGPSLFRPNNLGSGLKGYWKLDEASGTRADSSGNGNSLTDNNTVTAQAQDYWKTGENSADFEASNSEYLSIAHASQTGLSITGSWSSAAWIKIESSGILHTIAAKKDTDAAAGYRWGVYTDDKLYAYGDSTLYRATGPALSVGKWYHVAVVFDSVNSVILFYVNGNVDTVLAASDIPASNSIDFRLGSRSGGSIDYFDGLMKDAAIWDVVLTSIQIKSLALGIDLSSYAYRPNHVSTPPSHFYKLNEVSSGGGAVTRVDSAVSGGINLTDNNTVTTLGGYIEGAAADFETSNSEYLSGTGFGSIGTGDFTYALWAKFESLSGIQPSLGGRGTIANASAINLTVLLGSNQFYLYIGGVAKTWTWTPVINTWYHIVVKRSGTALSVYIDGVSLGGSNTSSANLTATDFYIGNDAVSTVNRMDGQIQDFAEWIGYALTDAEIKSLACGLPIQQTGLVSYFKMDETSGNAIDSISALNGVETSGTIDSVSGQVGTARDFEAGDTEYFLVPDSSEWDFGLDGMSILSWLKPESLGGGEYAYARGATPDFGLLVSSGGLNFYIEGNVRASYATPLGTAVWSHVACVRDGASARINLNSVQVGSGASTDDIQGTDGINIGSSAVPSGYYDGSMDELLIAKRWFRDEEIKTVYNKGLNGKEATSSERNINTGAFFAVM